MKKKILMLILALTMILALAGCKKEASKNPSEPSVNQENSSEAGNETKGEISLLSGRQYKKSPSPLPLKINAPLDISIFGRKTGPLAFLFQTIFPPKHDVKYNRRLRKKLRGRQYQFL